MEPVHNTGHYTNGESKYGDDIHYRAVPHSIKAAVQDDGSVKIEGWASTPEVDLGNDIVLPSAFKSS